MADSNVQTITYQGSSWVRFKRAINSKATLTVYTHSMKVFMCYMKTYDNADKLLSCTNEQIEDSITSFIEAQKEEGLSSSMIHTRLAAIKLFYEMNRRTLAWKMIRRTVGRTRKHKDRAYTKEEIRKLLELADLRTRVVILLLSSSGMRIGGVPGMQMKHLVPVDNFGIYKIIVYEGDEEEYITYCTPECRKTIEEYLAYRQRCGEKIIPESPLIRFEFDKNDMREVKNAKPVSEITIAALIKRLLVDAGIRPKTALVEGQIAARIRHEIKTLHGFRKFYDTELTKANVNLLWVEMLEGHDIKLKESYFRPTEEDLLEGNDKMSGYTAAIDALTINEKYRLKKQIAELEQKIKTAAPPDTVIHLEKKHRELEEQMMELEKNNKQVITAQIEQMKQDTKRQLCEQAKLIYSLASLADDNNKHVDPQVKKDIIKQLLNASRFEPLEPRIVDTCATVSVQNINYTSEIQFAKKEVDNSDNGQIANDTKRT